MKKLSKQLVTASMLILVILGAKARNLEKDTVFHNERDINFKVYENGNRIVLSSPVKIIDWSSSWSNLG